MRSEIIASGFRRSRWLAERQLRSLRRFEITLIDSLPLDILALMLDRPRHAVPEILVAGYFCLGLMPFIGIWVSPTSLNLMIALCGLYTTLTRFGCFPHFSGNGPLSWAVLALASSMLLSVYFSKLPHDSLELIVGMLPGVVLCLLIPLTHEPKRLALFIVIALFFTLIVLTVVCIKVSLLDNQPMDYKVFLVLNVALLQVPNDILLFTVFWPIVIWTVNSNKLLTQRQKNLVSFSYLTLILALSVLVDSRSSFLLALCCAISWLHAEHKFIASKFLLSIVAVGGFLVVVSPDFIDSLLALPKSSQRLWIWIVSIKMMDPGNYFIGVGHGLFATTFEAARPYIETPEGLLSDPRRMGWAHNLFIEAWVERGFIGLLSLTWVNWALLKRLHVTGLKAPCHRALMGVTLMLLITSCFELTFARAWVCAAYGCLIGAVLGLPTDTKGTKRTFIHNVYQTKS